MSSFVAPFTGEIVETSRMTLPVGWAAAGALPAYVVPSIVTEPTYPCAETKVGSKKRMNRMAVRKSCVISVCGPAMAER
jgi:hypothetical protein